MSLTNDKNGKENSAYSFNGNNSYIEVPWSGDVKIEEDITMSVWVKVKDKSDDGNYNGAYSRIISAPNSYYQMWLNWNNDGQNDREIYARSGGHGFEISSNNTITENTWKHVVYTFTSDTLKMYVDGTKVRTQYKSWSWNNGISNDGTLYIGSSSPNNNTFLGDLDNIRLYDRALTSDEITDLYSESLENLFLVK